MKAITTKYLPSTQTLPARMKAIEPDGRSVVMSCNELPGRGPGEITARHRAIAQALRQELGWKGDIVGGWLKDSMVWVFIY